MRFEKKEDFIYQSDYLTHISEARCNFHIIKESSTLNDRATLVSDLQLNPRNTRELHPLCAGNELYEVVTRACALAMRNKRASASTLNAGCVATSATVLKADDRKVQVTPGGKTIQFTGLNQDNKCSDKSIDPIHHVRINNWCIK